MDWTGPLKELARRFNLHIEFRWYVEADEVEVMVWDPDGSESPRARMVNGKEANAFRYNPAEAISKWGRWMLAARKP